MGTSRSDDDEAVRTAQLDELARRDAEALAGGGERRVQP